MAEWWEWTGEPGPLQANEAPEIDWSQYTSDAPGSWENQITTTAADGDGGNTNWLAQILSAVAPLAKQFGGPAASVIGSQVNANRGSNAVQTAGQQQSQALNRGIDLQTAQWLQQQRNLAPYLQAGEQGVSTLQSLAGREQPALPGARGTLNAADYQMASPTPGWTPQTYQGPQGPNAQDYRYTPGAAPQAVGAGYHGPLAVQAGNFQWQPGQGPSAQDYRYTPGAIPSAAANRWTPGQGPSAQGR